MPISLISCVINYSNKLAIGRNNGLLFRLKEDLKNFQTLTTGVLCKDSLLDKNVVLMGRKTWFSIPRDKRPLRDRINLILTNDNDLHKISPYPNVFNRSKFDKNVYFINFDQFLDFYKRTNANVYVIGGGEIYNKFLNMSNILLRPTKVYMTEVYNYKIEKGMEPDAFMDHLSEEYKLVGVSDKKFDVGYNVNYRFLEYRYIYNYRTDETKYNDLLKNVLYNGSERVDRTGVGTLSKFGYQYKMDISQSIPLLTTKKVPWKHCIEELLWFMRGDTDAKILQKQGVKIWDGNTSREFLDKRGLGHYKEGVLGAGYGWQWRFFGGNYSQAFSDTSTIDRRKVGGFDQLEYILNLLRNDPFSRRIMMSYWNPPDFEKTALLPCFPSGTLVLTNNGYKSIENVLLTDKLFTHKGNWKDIINLQTKEYNDDMYEFKLRHNSKSIKATKEHPFLVKDIIKKSDKTIIDYSSDVYWCNAEKITKDHVMCLPINKNNIIPTFYQTKYINQFTSKNIVKTLTQEDEWFMMGFYMGDGWINEKQKGVFNFCINKIDNVNLNIYKKISNVVHLTYRDETEKLIRYSSCNISWWEILKEFGHLAHNKKIPEWIQDAPKEYIQWFINGYIAADGCKTKENYERFTTVSANLAYGFQRLYAKLGKVLSVSYQKRPDTKIIEGRIVNQKDTYHMCVIKNNKCKYVNNIDENYIYFHIYKIDKKIENTKVYNFEVADDNSYTVQNVSVHNCHFSVQFYVEEDVYKQKHLSCHFTMRSNDLFLGHPFNIFSYAVMTYILAAKTNMKPKELVFTGGDVHIYKNHLEQVNEQLGRESRPFPKLILNPILKYKDFSDMTIDDFEIVGYFPHSVIKAPMAV